MIREWIAGTRHGQLGRSASKVVKRQEGTALITARQTPGAGRGPLLRSQSLEVLCTTMQQFLFDPNV
jgi:hypothetical protein